MKMLCRFHTAKVLQVYVGSQRETVCLLIFLIVMCWNSMRAKIHECNMLCNLVATVMTGRLLTFCHTTIFDEYSNKQVEGAAVKGALRLKATCLACTDMYRIP